ncbi:MAG: glutamate 5-kinase [Alicyclobacillus sp.]|nr:glutamate 5-kinase [Alicyclobacillus sp.]
MVVKVGSSSLTDEHGQLDPAKLERLVDQLARVQAQGWRVVLVSSGAVAAGVSRLGWRRATLTMPEKQAAAAVGQGLLIGVYEQLFAARGLAIGQVLLSRSDLHARRRFVHIRNTLSTLLERGVVPVVNENDTVAVDEIRFGDNDTLASYVALVVDAHRLVLLTDIDSLYTADPRTHAGAEPIREVRAITPELEQMAGGSGSQVGTGGMRTKINAAKIATSAGIEVVVAAANAPDVLLRVASGESVGTLFHARRRMPAKKAWVAHGTAAEGELYIDDGAVRALRRGAASLLFPGIVRVTGDFREGAVVACRSLDGSLVAKGIVHFSAGDLRVLLERRAAGYTLPPLHEVIHRDHLILVEEVGADGALG